MQTIRDSLSAIGISIKSFNSKRVTVEVEDRIEAIQTILSSFDGAFHDPDIKGSSIGAIVVNGYKIFIKNKQRVSPLQKEELALTQLSQRIESMLKETNSPLQIVLNDRIESIVGVRKTNGTPKSDFHLINEDNEQVVHISHKAGSKPCHFQQWSGLAEPKIKEHEYTVLFTEIAKDVFKDKISPRESLLGQLPIDAKAEELKLMSVYGTDCLSQKYSSNSVDVVLQGTPTLERLGDNHFKLSATGHVLNFPELPVGGFDPQPTLLYKGDRSNFEITGARASMYPVNGRTFKTVVPIC